MREIHKDYIHNRIENMLMSKIIHLEFEVKKYYEHRHEPMGGIDADMVKGLCLGMIRNLRVWKRMSYLINTKNIL